MSEAPKYRLTYPQACVLVQARWRGAWSARRLERDWQPFAARLTAEQIRRAGDALQTLGLLAAVQFSPHRRGFRITEEGRAEARRWATTERVKAGTAGDDGGAPS